MIEKSAELRVLTTKKGIMLVENNSPAMKLTTLYEF